ncbi:MAG TPA: copper resistance protein CopC, partial [Chloroflexota bacterium]
FACSSIASAHANLVNSDPPENAVIASTPSELRLWFSEAPEPVFSEVRLLDASGQPVQGLGSLRGDPSDATLLHVSVNPLTSGVYTVAWRTTSAVDGHVTSGSFAFVLGSEKVPAGGIRPVESGSTAPGAASAPEMLVRWLGYLGMALLAGGFAFFLFVLRPALQRDSSTSIVRQLSGPAEVEASASADKLGDGGALILRRVLVLLLAGWLITLVSTVAGSVFQAAAGAGVGPAAAVGPPLQRLLSATRYGAIFWVRLFGLEVLGMLVIYGLRGVRSGQAGFAWWIGGLAASEVVILTTSLNSHAAAVSPTLSSVPLSVFDDWQHLSAAAIWVGGLFYLALALRLTLHSTEERPSIQARHLVARFSWLATVCIVVIAITGVGRVFGEINGPEDLLGTPWGNTLLSKLGLMVPLLGLAFVNHFFVKGRLERAESRGRSEVGRWRKMLLWTVGGEVLVASILLGATSALVALPPAVDAYGAGLQLRGGSAEVGAIVVVNPSRPGPNSFVIYLRDSSRRPIVDAEKVALIFSSAEQDTGVTEAVAANLGDGRYRIQGSYLSILATWQIQLLVRRPGQEDERFDFVVRPSQLAGASADGHVH